MAWRATYDSKNRNFGEYILQYGQLLVIRPVGRQGTQRYYSFRQLQQTTYRKSWPVVDAQWASSITNLAGHEET